MRRGVGKDNLKPGTILKVEGFCAKDRSHNGYGVKITFADGRGVYISGSDAQPK